MAVEGAFPEAALHGQGDGVCVSCIHDSLRADEPALRALVRRVLQKENKGCRYLGIVLASGSVVRDLNRRYRGGDYDTDVLSFALSDGAEIDGEVYVNLDFALAHHAQYGATFEEEVRRYVVHGLLHLIGYDDAGSEARTAMRALEDRYIEARR